MKHIRQGHNECQLAVFAMLTDRTLEEVRKDVRGMCSNGYDIATNGDEYGYSTWVNVIMALGGKYGLLGWLIPSMPHNGGYRYILDVPYCSVKALLLVGKGSISLRGRCWGHIMAYENGLVHDPNMVGGMTWEEWVDEVDGFGFYGPLTDLRFKVNRLA